jgi:predicted 2-oxoglutarate/Fe(II)-dependent dioxygenase YbiX
MRRAPLPHFEEIGIGIYEAALLARDEARQLVTLAANNTNWLPASVQRNQQEYVVDPASRIAEVLYGSSADTLLTAALERLDSATSSVARALSPAASRLSDIQIIRYRPGGFFRTHRDNSSYLVGRSVTVLCYLNESFEGGGIHFPELRLRYRPRMGTGLVFPASYLHTAETVLCGEKFVLTAWYVSSVTTTVHSRPQAI